MQNFKMTKSKMGFVRGENVRGCEILMKEYIYLFTCYALILSRKKSIYWKHVRTYIV